VARARRRPRLAGRGRRDAVADPGKSRGRGVNVPWTLRRDLKTVTLMWTWICTQRQATEERPEAE